MQLDYLAMNGMGYKERSEQKRGDMNQQYRTLLLLLAVLNVKNLRQTFITERGLKFNEQFRLLY